MRMRHRRSRNCSKSTNGRAPGAMASIHIITITAPRMKCSASTRAKRRCSSVARTESLIRCMTFHTIPQAGEFGFDTWRPNSASLERQGANCWGGMALDEQRGIAYVTTGSPKTNFTGVDHRGDNLFANCVIALDTQTGKRLWHFQEIRHDIWDLDLPAPPNLVTVTRHGRRVDAVAAV